MHIYTSGCITLATFLWILSQLKQSTDKRYIWFLSQSCNNRVNKDKKCEFRGKKHPYFVPYGNLLCTSGWYWIGILSWLILDPIIVLCNSNCRFLDPTVYFKINLPGKPPLWPAPWRWPDSVTHPNVPEWQLTPVWSMLWILGVPRHPEAQRSRLSSFPKN